MKPSVWFLWALVALGSATLQDTQGTRSQTTADLEDTAEVSSNRSLISLSTPDQLQEKKSGRSSTTSQSSTLTWQSSSGSLLPGAVSIFNTREGRTDYVCRHGCFSGFFTPSLGPYCHYPVSGQERRVYRFHLLVNKDNFELLEWKRGSRGRVPEHAVQTCPGGDVYVGRNTYGLGKVQRSRKAFFLPWRGREYRYSGYEVLTISRNFETEQMYDVVYNRNFPVTQLPPEVLHHADLTNRDCGNAEKTAKLSRTVMEEKRWDVSTSTTFLTSITVPVPIISSLSITLGLERTIQVSRGATVVESKTFSQSITKTVPPNQTCQVRMMGCRYLADIPFTAKLRRTYNDGQTKVRTITGTFRGVSMGGIKSEVDQCQPVPSPSHCP